MVGGQGRSKIGRAEGQGQIMMGDYKLIMNRSGLDHDELIPFSV